MKPTETKTKAATGVKKMVASKFHFEEHPSKIREARIGAKLSQDAMAEKLECAHTTYGEIERGRRPVRKETGERIAGLLKTPVNSIFTAQGKKLIAKRA